MKTNADGLNLIEMLKCEYEPAESRTNIEKALNALVKRRLTNNQFSALVSLGMYIGLDKLKKVIKRINSVTLLAEVADCFDQHIYHDDEHGRRTADPFLIKQRELERELFTRPQIVKKRGEK